VARAAAAAAPADRLPRTRVVRIAHDFNNLLMTILGHCDLLERGAEGSTDAVSQIRTAVDAASGLTRELMAVADQARSNGDGRAGLP
jgi:hypothetical protein